MLISHKITYPDLNAGLISMQLPPAAPLTRSSIDSSMGSSIPGVEEAAVVVVAVEGVVTVAVVVDALGCCS